MRVLGMYSNALVCFEVGLFVCLIILKNTSVCQYIYVHLKIIYFSLFTKYNLDQ